MGKGLIIGIIVLVVIVAGFVYIGLRDTTPEQAPNIVVNVEEGETTTEGTTEEETIDTTEETTSEPQTLTVDVAISGFSPKELTIKSGDTVTWTVTSSTRTHYIASALHPTHTLYPGSAINKCNTAGGENIFDQCDDMKEGESWSFTFDEVGTWRYHDHLKAISTGTIVVE